MIRGALLGILTVILVAFSAYAEAESTPASHFAPGQEWSIKSASPTTAKIIIGRVERWRDNVCVNVSIIDIPIPQGLPGAGGMTRIDHLPFDEAALTASVDQLLSTGNSPSPNFESGYKQWKDANGGVFTISVPQAIEFALEAIGRQHA